MTEDGLTRMLAKAIKHKKNACQAYESYTERASNPDVRNVLSGIREREQHHLALLESLAGETAHHRSPSEPNDAQVGSSVTQEELLEKVDLTRYYLEEPGLEQQLLMCPFDRIKNNRLLPLPVLKSLMP